MTEEEALRQQAYAKFANDSYCGSSQACACIGPQNGEPACPCAMASYRLREAQRKQVEEVVERRLGGDRG